MHKVYFMVLSFFINLLRCLGAKAAAGAGAGAGAGSGTGAGTYENLQVGWLCPVYGVLVETCHQKISEKEENIF